MASYITIDKVGLWLDDVEDEEDAAYARWVAASLEADDLHTETTLREQLAELTRSIQGLRVAVGFRTEEWRRDVVAYAGGMPSSGDPPDRAPATDAQPGKRRIAPSYAAYIAADEDARRAVDRDDLAAMLALLDDLRLTPAPPHEVRHAEFREPLRARRARGTRARIRTG